VIKNFQTANKARRLQIESLTLGALVIYQLNALIYRPAEGNAESALLEAARQPFPDEEHASVAHSITYRRGAYFASDIVNDGVYRLPHGRAVSEEVLLTLYRVDYLDDIEAALDDADGQMTGRKRAKTGPLATTKRRKTTYNLQVASYSGKSDAGLNESEDDTTLTVKFLGNPTTAATGLSEVSDILHCLPFDILNIAPVPRSNIRWLLLDSAQHEKTKIDIFQTLKLRRIFLQTVCRILPADEWRSKVFDLYFPPKGLSKMHIQHFPSTKYYRQWAKLMDRTPEDVAKSIRERVYSWFSQLQWLPFPESDRMWSTKDIARKGSFLVPSTGVAGNWPHIAINSSSCCSADIEELRG
jgi:hypothetical protein